MARGPCTLWLALSMAGRPAEMLLQVQREVGKRSAAPALPSPERLASFLYIPLPPTCSAPASSWPTAACLPPPGQLANCCRPCPGTHLWLAEGAHAQGARCQPIAAVHVIRCSKWPSPLHGIACEATEATAAAPWHSLTSGLPKMSTHSVPKEPSSSPRPCRRVEGHAVCSSQQKN